MVTRKTKKKKKPATRRKKATTHGGAGSTRSKSTNGRKKSSASKLKPKSAAKRKKSAPAKTGSLIQSGISVDRKLEIVGILIALVGFLTLLTIASSTRSEATNVWVNLWLKAFGWGAYFLPIALVGLGIWMVVRNFERVPHLTVERLLGFTFLVLIFQIFLHLWISPPGRDGAYQIAEAGQGGGYLGAWLMVLLEGGLGTLGMVIALIGWFIISLGMALDISVIELFKWVPPLILRLQASWKNRQADQNTFSPSLEEFSQTPSPQTSFELEPVEKIAHTAVVESLAETIPTSVPDAELEQREGVLPVPAEMLDEGAEETYGD
ncbi:MAG: DNA translocase FtsK 4TM domain-containing protein, partial [Chloroflexota bacterium]